MLKKLVLILTIVLEAIFLKQVVRIDNVQAANCGGLNQVCCSNNTCNQGLVCKYAGNNLGVMMCFDKNTYVDPTTAGVKDKVFCDSSGQPTNDPSSGKIYTAIGCVPVSTSDEFVVWILNWAIGIGGGIALLLIILASFQIMTSSGVPEKAQAGKELLTSAIAGLVLLIFSIFILKVIGVDILKIPGLN